MISQVLSPVLLLTLSAIVPSIAVAGLRPVTIFLAPLVGGLMAGFAAECELAAGGTLAFWFIIVAVLVNLVSFLARLALPRPGDRTNRSTVTWRMLHVDEEWRRPWPWITAVVIAGAVAWPLRALHVPIIVYDARHVWTLHSLFIYGGHQTYLAALKNPVYAFSNPNYPPLVSATGALGFDIHGGTDIHLAVSLTAILNACALGVAACGIASVSRKDVPAWTRAVAIGCGAALCLIGFGIDEPLSTSFFGAFVNGPFAVGAMPTCCGQRVRSPPLSMGSCCRGHPVIWQSGGSVPRSPPSQRTKASPLPS